MTDTQTPRRNLTSNRFLLGIVRAWDAVKIFLRKEMPNIWDGWMNQPLLANSLVRDSTGNVLGLRPRLAWGKLDNGPAASVGSWIHFQQMPEVDRLKQLHSIYGAKTMIRDISAAFSQASSRLQPMQEHLWFGCLMNDMMLFVKGTSTDGCIFYFHIQQDNKLQPYTPSDKLLRNLLAVPVRVIAKTGKKWLLDPQPSISHLSDMLWLYAWQPINRLMWDPGGWSWTSPMMDPMQKVMFF